jgi:hypothetical protein
MHDCTRKRDHDDTATAVAMKRRRTVFLADFPPSAVRLPSDGTRPED